MLGDFNYYRYMLVPVRNKIVLFKRKQSTYLGKCVMFQLNLSICCYKSSSKERILTNVSFIYTSFLISFSWILNLKDINFLGVIRNL
jgi:hypothetical protein